MAVFSFVPVAPTSTGAAANVLFAGALGASGVQTVTVGKNCIFRIAVATACTIRFGVSATLGNAGANDVYLPAGTREIWDMGNNNDTISIFSYAAANQVSVSTIVRN